MAGPLEGIRVLDLTTPLAEPTGRVLADLGAEVIKIEPPGGCASRFTPPFESGKQGDPMGSLFWRAWGLGKRSVVLDPTSESDRTALLELARGADVFIESGTPGELESQGLGANALCAANPALLYVSVTPFGQTGPDARNPATDLTLAAAGGLLQMQGDPDRAPLPVGYPEASCHGAVQAAADTVLALYERNRTGRGQHDRSQRLDEASHRVSFVRGGYWASVHGGLWPATGDSHDRSSRNGRTGPRGRWVFL